MTKHGSTAEQVKRAIEPGSVPFGQRQELEAQIGQALGATSPGQTPTPQPGPTVAPTSADPVGALLGGGVNVQPDVLTAGLSVGPGPGTMADEVPTELEQRLMLLAQQARSPQLRAMARMALRRIKRRGEET
jgi:hypothetical protein